jgi:hypothetical protein
MKRTALLIGFVFLMPVAGFFSCIPCEQATKRNPRYFDITGLECSNYEITPGGNAQEYTSKLLPDGASVKFANHKVAVALKFDYYSYQPQEKQYRPTAAAYALSCDPPAPFSQEGLDTLYVITAQALDNLHAQGDTINDIIAVQGGRMVRYADFNQFGPLQAYIHANRERILDPYLSFRLTQVPQFRQTTHSFKLVYLLKNGEVYTAQTNTILFE